MRPRLSASDGKPDVSAMDPWKDDRCRDFVALNTIQRLRAYHLPVDEPLPPVEPINKVRGTNLTFLPRATPDYRPCLGEVPPAPTRVHGTPRGGANRKRPKESCRESSSSASTTPMDSDEERDGTSKVAEAGTMGCAVDRARVVFFGSMSFTPSTSSRHTATSAQASHVSSLVSRSQPPAGEAGASMTAPLSLDSNVETTAGSELDAQIAAHSTPLKPVQGSAVGSRTPGTAERAERRDQQWPLDAPSPAVDAPPPTKLPAAEALDSCCASVEAVVAHYQSLLTRGVVLDRFTYKELSFVWWVIGRNMDAAALDHPGPMRREPLLMMIRNFYYRLLSSKRRHPSRGVESDAGPSGLVPQESSMRWTGDASEVRDDKAIGGGVPISTATNEEGKTPVKEEEVSAASITPDRANKRARQDVARSTESPHGRVGTSEEQGLSQGVASSEPLKNIAHVTGLQVVGEIREKSHSVPPSLNDESDDGSQEGALRGQRRERRRAPVKDRRKAVKELWQPVRGVRRRAAQQALVVMELRDAIEHPVSHRVAKSARAASAEVVPAPTVHVSDGAVAPPGALEQGGKSPKQEDNSASVEFRSRERSRSGVPGKHDETSSAMAVSGRRTTRRGGVAKPAVAAEPLEGVPVAKVARDALSGADGPEKRKDAGQRTTEASQAVSSSSAGGTSAAIPLVSEGSRTRHETFTVDNPCMALTPMEVEVEQRIRQRMTHDRVYHYLMTTMVSSPVESSGGVRRGAGGRLGEMNAEDASTRTVCCEDGGVDSALRSPCRFHLDGLVEALSQRQENVAEEVAPRLSCIKLESSEETDREARTAPKVMDAHSGQEGLTESKADRASLEGEASVIKVEGDETRVTSYASGRECSGVQASDDPVLSSAAAHYLQRPFETLPYAQQCLLVWEAAGILRDHEVRQRQETGQHQLQVMTTTTILKCAHGCDDGDGDSFKQEQGTSDEATIKGDKHMNCPRQLRTWPDSHRPSWPPSRRYFSYWDDCPVFLPL